MEIKTIGIVTDWGIQNPSHSILEKKLRDIFGKQIPIHFIRTDIFPLFPIQSIYPIRKGLRLLGPNTLMLNLCSIHRYSPASLSLMEVDDSLVICTGNTDYMLYDENLSYVKNVSLKPISDLRDFIDELTFMMKNMSDVVYEDKSASNAYLPRLTRNGMEIQILDIDLHENIITNLTHEKYVKEIAGKKWSLQLLQYKVKYEKHGWAETKNLDLFSYFNSAGLLKIVKKNGLVASTFGYRMAPEQYMSNQNIEISIDYDN